MSHAPSMFAARPSQMPQGCQPTQWTVDTASYSDGLCDMSGTAGPRADNLTYSAQCSMFCEEIGRTRPQTIAPPDHHPMPGMEQPLQSVLRLPSESLAFTRNRHMHTLLYMHT